MNAKVEENPRIPVHVSIIMDGNGRWARERGLERVQGHFQGVKSVRACTEAAVEAGVRYLSLFAFSEENWNRPAEEVSTLMKLMMKSIADECERLLENGVRFKVIGNLSRLSDPLLDAIHDLEAKTARNTRLTLVIFLSYSGKWDILQAAKAMAKDYSSNPSAVDNLSMEDFGKYLATAEIPDPDLLIRTSGELRISNFLLWQTAYSEFCFTDVLWPDFGKEQFFEAIAEYGRRDRRYGKVK